MKLKDIIGVIEQLAPRSLQEKWDNSGLQVGNPEQLITSVLVCLDITEAVVEEAETRGCNLIISHHPLLFNGLKHITTSTYIERCVRRAIKNDIAIYSAHTSLDNASQGVNIAIAKLLGLTDIEILVPKQQALYKLVTYVPHKQVEQVRSALFDAGAGTIGNYDQCSYNIQGIGTFRANDAARPFVGDINEQHHEPETRVEVILPRSIVSKVVGALIDAHPYEEPAYDIIPIENCWNSVGLGAVGNLAEAMDETAFMERVKAIFNVPHLRRTPLTGRQIKRIALCGGSGSEFVRDAIAAHADAFITADIKYHAFFDTENKILLIDAGHHETEYCTKQLFAQYLAEKLPELMVIQSEKELSPMQWN